MDSQVDGTTIIELTPLCCCDCWSIWMINDSCELTWAGGLELCNNEDWTIHSEQASKKCPCTRIFLLSHQLAPKIMTWIINISFECSVSLCLVLILICFYVSIFYLRAFLTFFLSVCPVSLVYLSSNCLASGPWHVALFSSFSLCYSPFSRPNFSSYLFSLSTNLIYPSPN